MGQLEEIVARLASQLGPAAGPPEPLEGGITNRNYRVRFGERDYVLPAAYADVRALAERIAGALALSEPVPCHNDLLPGNLLQVGDTVALVDWEYAGMGHRLFDLGNLAVNNGFDADDERRLLDAYFG